MIKLFQPSISKKAGKYLTETLYSGTIAEGPRVKEFEEKFAETFNKKNVVSLNSGTSALEMAYHLADIQEGDEVISSVLTCTATNVPLVRRKAKIVWADINPTELTISATDVLQKINPKTKALVYVHMGGNNYGLRDIKAICKKYGVILIEDAAQALGSEEWGIGDHTAVSLQAIKNLTTGDGGIYIGRRYAKAKQLRWFGYDRDKKQEKGDINLLDAGYKWHMNDLSASIGLANLEDWDKNWRHKQKLHNFYKQVGFNHGSWLVWGFTDNYKELKEVAELNGFEIGQHHYRNDKYTVFGGRVTLPNMDKIEKQYFFVPSHFGVTLKDAERIADVCQHFLK
jgi:dTDP-4-amino-4,6-dideoxygalactose transaminase